MSEQLLGMLQLLAEPASPARRHESAGPEVTLQYKPLLLHRTLCGEEVRKELWNIQSEANPRCWGPPGSSSLVHRVLALSLQDTWNVLFKELEIFTKPRRSLWLHAASCILPGKNPQDKEWWKGLRSAQRGRSKTYWECKWICMEYSGDGEVREWGEREGIGKGVCGGRRGGFGRRWHILALYFLLEKMNRSFPFQSLLFARSTTVG